MLDLDVGFIDSPLNIVRKLHDSKKDIFVQVISFLTLSFLRIFLRKKMYRSGSIVWPYGFYTVQPTPQYNTWYLLLSYSFTTERFGVCDEPLRGGVAHVVHWTHAQYR